MMTKEGSTRIVNFKIPRTRVLVLGRCHISHIVKMHYSFENLLLYFQAKIRQARYIVMISKERSTKSVTFMTPGAGVFVLGCGHMSYSENALFL